MHRIIDGKGLASKIKEDLSIRVRDFEKEYGKSPCLAVVLVGDDPASSVYVRNKQKSCQQVGITSILHHLPGNTTEQELIDLIEKLNSNPEVNGILIQLPLPPHLDEKKFIKLISPVKDVDGFHPENVGMLATGNPRFIPCTPLGIMEMFREYNVPLEGAEVTIVGRSNIVGRPMAYLLISNHATVTVCHSKTRDIEKHCSRADILISATGKPGMVRSHWVKEGAVVIDVGISRMPDGKLKGDVEFSEVKEKASLITPVPGGVGPMTVAMLLKNTLIAARMQQN